MKEVQRTAIRKYLQEVSGPAGSNEAGEATVPEVIPKPSVLMGLIKKMRLRICKAAKVL